MRSSGNNHILKTLQENAHNEDALIQDFKLKASEVARINQDTNTPIHQDAIQTIKRKVAQEPILTYHFTDDQIKHPTEIAKESQ